MLAELTNAQRRQFVDAVQIFEAWEDSRAELGRRFAGSMRWVERKGHVYLLRKQASREVSLGRKTEKTEEIHRAFREGRDRERHRYKELDARLKEMAPVNRALRLNRVPLITARILRHLASAQVLGRNISVVGTNSLYLYEALAGVQLRSDLLATGDVDLFWDARQSLSLSVSDFRREGVIGHLRRADRSFRRARGQHYRAINQHGFTVDLIPPANDLLAAADEHANEVDLVGAGIEGLEWLVNAPKVDGVVIGEDGIPLRCWSVDPRAFALHKAWVAGRADREPVRRLHDRAQAREVARIARHYLGMEMSDSALSVLPSFMRGFADDLHRSCEEAIHDGRHP
ncbi:MAG: nucleotidyltransferase domain-containing protein [bacterium]|nr:nucleotidyltransferase domain-containing protein [bacterium]